MRRELLWGVIAGAAGTMALDVTTYLDMALRARPASQVPAQVAGTLAERVGLDLSPDGDGQAARNRRGGLGALLGYGVGVGVGAAYGLLRSRARRVPLPLAAAGLGLAAMAASDVPAVTLKVTDPRTWGASGWLADAVPHLAYGWATAAAYDEIARH